MNKSRIIVMNIFLAAVLLVVDQFSKTTMKAFMESRSVEPLELIPGFCTIVHSYNTGVAFGMFKGAPALVLYLPVLIVIILMIFIMKSGGGGVLRFLGSSFILGGAAGNLMDRIRIGKVYDFIDLHVASYHWPAFNAADSFIVIGVFLFGIAMLRGEFDV